MLWLFLPKSAMQLLSRFEMVCDKFVQEFFLSFWMYFVPKTKKNSEIERMNTDQGLLLRTSRVVCKNYLYVSAKNEGYPIFDSSCVKFVTNMTHLIMNLAADVSSAFNQINYQKSLDMRICIQISRGSALQRSLL